LVAWRFLISTVIGTDVIRSHAIAALMVVLARGALFSTAPINAAIVAWNV
jgi:hypothetical protein